LYTLPPNPETRSARNLTGFREAIALYLDELREQGSPVPVPTTDTEYVAV